MIDLTPAPIPIDLDAIAGEISMSIRPPSATRILIDEIGAGISYGDIAGLVPEYDATAIEGTSRSEVGGIDLQNKPGDSRRGVVTFDVSQVPDMATQVEMRVRIDFFASGGLGGPDHVKIGAYDGDGDGDPESDSDSELYAKADVSSDYYLDLVDSAISGASGVFLDLGLSAVQHLNAQRLGNGKFSLAFLAEGNDPYWHFRRLYSSEQGSDGPYLRVTSTPPSELTPGPQPIETVLTVPSVGSILSPAATAIPMDAPAASLDVDYPVTPAVQSVPLSGQAASVSVDIDISSPPHSIPISPIAPAAVAVHPISAGVRLPFRAPINREGCGLRCHFYGARSETWSLSIRIVDDEDPDKWAQFDFGGLVGFTAESLDVADIEGTPDATGPNGAPDFRALGSLEFIASNGSFVFGDSFLLDAIEWYGGALNGVVLDGSDLVSQEQGDPYWPEDLNTPYWSANPSDPFWISSNYLEGVYEFSATPDSGSVPCDVRLEINDDIGVEYSIEYKVGQRFVPFPGLISIDSTNELRFRLLLAGGLTQARVTDLKVIYDVPDESEFLENVSIAATGTVRLPITKSYRSIREVLIVHQSTGAKSSSVLDKDPVNGPSVEVYNSSGTRIAATIDAAIRGVKGQ